MRISEQVRQESIGGDAAVKGLRVYKARLPDGTGWAFTAAANRKMAAFELSRIYSCKGEVCAASHSDLVRLASRALMGV